MKKLCSLLLCAALIMGLAAGCARVTPEETEPPVTETAAPTEWVLEETAQPRKYEGVTLVMGSSWAEDAPEAAVLTQAAEVFEARTGAVVELRWGGEEAADILQLSGTALAEGAGDLLDLTELAAAAGYAEKSYSCLTEQVVSRCGYLAAIPQTPYVTGIYYNREAFEAAGIAQTPQTWSAFLEVCAALKAAGWEPLTLNSEDAGPVLLRHLTQYLGAEAENIARTGGWQEKALDAAADLVDFAGAGYLVSGAPAGENRVTLSNAAMVYGTNALCARAEEAARADLRWGMFPYPGVGGAEPVISVDAEVLAVSAACAAPQAAFDFILLLTTGEFDQLRADLTKGIPADPGNVSPIAGASEALTLAQTVEPANGAFTEEQLNVILKLWKGKCTESAAFAAEMDRLYPET
ncbi:MAG: extracellular solute-binding protein [Oscillospiraceae bacterium]|nr:extracellular solute-binding protein [Oscillospiraceae bacterium]